MKIIQRVCWNTNDWKAPSGSSTEQGFPEINGFGHEEWNFNVTDSFNGYIFTYTYLIPEEQKLKLSNGKFTICFFCQHPSSKRWMLIGYHRNAQLIEENEFSDIINHFDKNGIFERRAKELISASNYFKTEQAALDEVKNAFLKRWIRIKCKVENVEYLDTPIYIKKPSNHRFKSFTYVDTFPKESTDYISSSKTTSVLAENAYLRASTASLKIIIPRHNKLSNIFCRWLKTHKVEPTQEKNFVDVTFAINETKYIAELKITYGISTKKAIRESIGQLFEYNLYPGRTLNDVWLIVLDTKPSSKDKDYIDNINDKYKTRISLAWQQKNDFIFHPKSIFS